MRATRLVEAIKPFAKKTLRPGGARGIGGFGALAEIPKKYREPVLVSGTDASAPSESRLSAQAPRHRRNRPGGSERQTTFPQRGASVLPRLYVCERLDVRVATESRQGIAAGCELAGCALICGETPASERVSKDEY